MSRSAKIWKIRDRELSLEKPLIMGILNVTPDSFSDGGEHNEVAAAVSWAQRMRSEGADIVDVGGESTRPGADDVPPDEELRRVIPVVRALCAEGFIVSVDTMKPEVMREALGAGAQIINDVYGFRAPGAVDAVRDSGAGLVLMHMQGMPRTMQQAPHYEDVVREVALFLHTRSEALERAGIRPEQICWDPGFGFGKTVDQNFALLAATDQFVQSGYPFLMALSRKSSVGAVTGVANPADRVTGSVAGALIAVQKGAHIVRVHDVRETREAFAVYSAVNSAGAGQKAAS